MLALRAGVPVVPMVHNAGSYWLRKRILIRPGTVQFKIGPAISVDDRTVNEINRLAMDWIESNRPALDRAEASGNGCSAADRGR